MATHRNHGSLVSLLDVAMPAPVQGSVPLWSSALVAAADSSRAWGIGTTSTVALRLANTTPATAEATAQHSPALEFGSTVWNTTASKTKRWRIEDRPVSAASPNSFLTILASEDAGAFSKVASLGSHGYLEVKEAVTIGTALYFFVADTWCGLGVTGGIQYTDDGELALIQRNRTDGANNIVISSCYMRLAAAITNANTMRLHSFGFTTDAYAYSELAAVYCNGLMGVGSFAAASLPAAVIAGRIGYSADADGGNPCLIVDTGSAIKKIALAAI